MLSESTIRFACFLAIFAAMAVWEIFAPVRRLREGRPRRWLANMGVNTLNSILILLILPGGATAIALLAEHYQIGWLNRHPASLWFTVPVSVVFLDFLIYIQHILFHRFSFLWPFHAAHHADLDLDVTSGVRFHPVEIIISFGIKTAVILLLGLPALAVIVFEIILNGASMFNHSNVKIPERWDTLIRRVIVTPDMHRVHHSVRPRETHTNFGFCFSIWDCWLGTYIPQPRDGHLGMTIGLPGFQDAHWAGLWDTLTLPFRYGRLAASRQTANHKRHGR